MPADPNHCPYCGYDLRGVYASWERACPLRLTCSECGHEFDVGELRGPPRPAPPVVRGPEIPGKVVVRVVLLSLLGVVLVLAIWQWMSSD